MPNAQLFPKGTLPRRPRKHLMHVYDAGSDHGHVNMVCSCGYDDGFLYCYDDKTLTQLKRGLPCPICNTEEGTTIMTHSGGKQHTNVGDKGQRYEVRAYKADTGEQTVIGWTTKADGGSLMEGVKLWPAMRDPFIVDREKLGEQLESMADL